MRAGIVAVVVGVLAVSGSAARLGPSQSDADRPARQRALAEARARWDAHSVQNYEFVLVIPPEMPSWSQRIAAFRVTGSSRETLAPPTGPLAAVFHNRNSVDALFDLIAERLATTSSVMSASYDDELGYPQRATFQDAYFQVSTFRAFARLSDVRDPFVLAQHVNHCGLVNGCPDYSIAAWGDGTVVYVGEGGVSTAGRRTHSIGVDGAAALARAFDASRFSLLSDEYFFLRRPDGTLTSTSHVTEQWLTFRVDGRQKTVHDFYGRRTPSMNSRSRSTELPTAAGIRDSCGSEWSPPPGRARRAETRRTTGIELQRPRRFAKNSLDTLTDPSRSELILRTGVSLTAAGSTHAASDQGIRSSEDLRCDRRRRGNLRRRKTS